MNSNGVPTIVAVAVALAACGVLDPAPSWEDRRAELEYHRSVWESAGVQSYRYRLRRSCFCAGAGTLIITVKQGNVVGATSIHSGEPVPEEALRYLETVDDLFDVIEWAIDHEADSFRATYHRTLGYPTVIDLDPVHAAIDDELYLEASDLVAPPFPLLTGWAQPTS